MKLRFMQSPAPAGLAASIATAALAVACAVPLPASQQAAATPAPLGPGGSTFVRGEVPTATPLPAAPTAVLPPDAPPPTPFAVGTGAPLRPEATPLAPLIPAFSAGAPAPPATLDAGSQPAATAIVGTAVAQASRTSATAIARPSQQITIKDLAFQPGGLTVPPGTTVIWRNTDRVTHQVKGGEFDSGRMAAGTTWASVMERPGRFAFICSFHPNMRAEINVSPDTSRPIHMGS